MLHVNMCWGFLVDYRCQAQNYRNWQHRKYRTGPLKNIGNLNLAFKVMISREKKITKYYYLKLEKCSASKRRVRIESKGKMK